MSRHCSICEHPNRDEIDAALTDGQSLRDIAKRFGTTKSALSRHQSGHLAPAKTENHGDPFAGWDFGWQPTENADDSLRVYFKGHEGSSVL